MSTSARTAVASALAAAALILTGCGGSTESVTFKMHVWYNDIGATEGEYYVVYSGSGDTFDRAIEVHEAFVDGSGLIERLDGDRHEGELICEFSIDETMGGDPVDDPVDVAVYADPESMSDEDIGFVRGTCS